MIQIDCLDLSGLTEQDYKRLYQSASPQRRAKADRYLRREDQLRCVCAEALLRNALKKRDISVFTVSVRDNGKPYVADVEDFHYNISHSGRWVVLAYGESPVGVDVEQIRSEAPRDVAQRFFTTDEQDYVQDNPQRFFLVWTGKESYLKYLGTGLKKALSSFSVLEELGVKLFALKLEDACLTLCTREDGYNVTMLENI